METVLFVCASNMWRSVIPEYEMNKIIATVGEPLQSKFIAASAGIYPPSNNQKNISDYPTFWRAAKPVLINNNIDPEYFSKRTAALLTPAHMKNAEHVLAMERDIFSVLCREYPQHHNTCMFNALAYGPKAKYGTVDLSVTPRAKDLERSIKEIKGIIAYFVHLVIEETLNPTQSTY